MLSGLQTPRQVLAEMDRAKFRPWWLSKHLDELRQHLTRATFNGCPLIDTPMSQTACEAVLEEAVDYVTRPRTHAELLAELRADVADHIARGSA